MRQAVAAAGRDGAPVRRAADRARGGALEPQGHFAVRWVHASGGFFMLGLIAAVLIVCWLFGFFALHVSSFLIHILLIVGVIMLIAHFVRGRSSA
jgi:predicted lipid-binding transport protein (Tim44 family)